MELSQLQIAIGLTLGALILAGIAFYLYYHRSQNRLREERLQELSRDVTKTLEERGVRHPELIENKLATAEEHWQKGNYKEAERAMEDLLDIVRLS